VIRPVSPPPDRWLADALEAVRAELQRLLRVLPGLDPRDDARKLPGGKLLRPRLLLAMAAATGGTASVNGRVTSLAAVVELIHLATLYHDDVLDASSRRRRVASVRQRLGNKISILFGDALLATAVDTMLRRADRRTLTTIARAVTATLQGEMEQHLRHRTLDLEEKACLRAARLKTGSLFGLAARLGAMLGGSTVPAPGAPDAARFGRRVGTAFQLIDDALDYAGSFEVLGKEPGADYREGIATLPLVHAWRTATPAERHVLELGFGRRTGGFGAVRAIVLRPARFVRTQNAARRHLERGRAELARIDGLDREFPMLDAFIRDIELRIPDPAHEPRLRESVG
jgi:octaprenyl-diphosphate synthase